MCHGISGNATASTVPGDHVGGKQRFLSLDTTSHQAAMAKLRRFEVRLAERGEDAVATKTPIADVVAAYIAHLRVAKTKNPAARATSTLSARRLRSPLPRPPGDATGGAGTRRSAATSVVHIEKIRTQDIVAFLHRARVQQRNLTQDRKPVPLHPLPSLQLGPCPSMASNSG